MLISLVGLLAGCSPKPVQEQKITWISTQLTPIEEAEFVRKEILKPFTDETGIQVEFIGAEYGELFTRLQGEALAGRGSIDLMGGLQGDFVGVAEFLSDVGDVLSTLKAQTFSPSDLKLADVDGRRVFVPWMTATYFLVANKKALEYLPAWAAINGLTYEQLRDWVKAIEEDGGGRKLGIPAGPRSLLHRFVHGYAYPSYTGSQVKRFAGDEAVAMWEFLRDLWQFVNPAVATADAMDALLLDETVWIAWDHAARVKQALLERPDDFIAFPAPAGPAGRGFIPILAGLGIPANAPNRDAAAKLIEFLTRPETQVKVLQGVGFFPVVEEASGATPAGGLKVMAAGVAAQSGAPDALPALIPGGLGKKGGEFSKIYRDTFTEIVLGNRDIRTVLREQGQLLKELFAETNAQCPLPDPPETLCVPEGL